MSDPVAERPKTMLGRIGAILAILGICAVALVFSLFPPGS